MVASSICLLFLAAAFTWATASGSECDQKALAKFDMKKLLDCGYNGESWSIWNVPGRKPYCAQDIFDKSEKDDFICYDIKSNNCHRERYLYSIRKGDNGPNYLERDLGNGDKTTSMILDTDNCHYIVQLECFPDGSVSRYVTYKSSWTSADKDKFNKKAADNEALSFAKDYTFDCKNGKV